MGSEMCIRDSFGARLFRGPSHGGRRCRSRPHGGHLPLARLLKHSVPDRSGLAAPLLIPQGPRGAVPPLQVVERVVGAAGRPPCVLMATCCVWLLEHMGRGQVSRRMPKSMPPFFGWAMRACRSMRNQALAGSVSLVCFGSLRAGCWFRFGVAVRPQLVRSHACPG